MISHERARDLLSIGIDFTLTDGEQQALSQHTCGECRGYEVLLRSDAERLAALPDLQPPGEAWAAIEAAMGTGSRHQLSRATLVIVTALLLAALAGATIAIGAWLNRDRTPFPGGTAQLDLGDVVFSYPAGWHYYPRPVPGMEGMREVGVLTNRRTDVICAAGDPWCYSEPPPAPGTIWIPIIEWVVDSPTVLDRLSDGPLPPGVEWVQLGGRPALYSESEDGEVIAWFLVPPSYPERYYEISAGPGAPGTPELRDLLKAAMTTVSYTGAAAAPVPYPPLPDPELVAADARDLLLVMFADEPRPEAVDVKLREAMTLFPRLAEDRLDLPPHRYSSGLALITARGYARTNGCPRCTAEDILDELLANPADTPALTTALLEAARRLTNEAIDR